MEYEVKIAHDSETPAQGQQVFTACAFIYRCKDDILELFVPKRAKTKKFLPWIYELPGGHIDFWEDMRDGLKREISEEFWKNVQVGDCFDVFTYTNHIKWSQSLEAIYFSQFIDDEKNIVLHPEDHEGYVWISEKEINTIITAGKQEDDYEIQAIKKGFSILKEEYNWNVS